MLQLKNFLTNHPGPDFDAHMHIDWVQNIHEFSSELEDLDMFVFGCTCLPQNFCPYSSRHIFSALGAHPWFLDDCDMDVFFDYAKSTQYIGEVGLDGCRPNMHLQIDAFKQICNVIRPGSILSIHCVKTKGACLGILEEAGILSSCTCIFHSFADDANSLNIAIKSGCYFSVGERMLSAKRGREYIKQIPVHQLLLESDSPNKPYSLHAQDLLASLTNIQKQLHILKPDLCF